MIVRSLNLITVFLVLLAARVHADTPLSYCLSRAVVGVTVGENVSTLGDARSGDHTMTLRSALLSNLREYGATPLNIIARPTSLGSLEGLVTALNEAEKKQASLLVVLELSAKEYRLSNPYIGGDHFPLRTIQLLIHVWVISGQSRDVWSDFTLDSSIAAYSVDEAVSKFASEELADPLAKALRDGCDELQRHPQQSPKPEYNAPSPAPQPLPPTYTIVQKTQASTTPIISKRVALVIGNNDYAKFHKLHNARKDAETIAGLLTAAGFQIIATENMSIKDHQQFEGVIDRFRRRAKDSDATAIYFAGHGATVDGKNYAFFESASSERDENGRVSLDELMQISLKAGAPVKIVMLDACRDVVTRGIVDEVLPPGVQRGYVTNDQAQAQGIALVFSASPGAEVDDGPLGENGRFVRALSKHIVVPGKRILDVFNDTALDVAKISENTQVPWISATGINSNFFFISK